jgi:hypothetical protein
MPDVFNYVYHLPIKPTLQRESILIPKGYGYEETVTRGSSQTRADGTGGAVAAYKGRWIFEIEIRAQDYADGDYQSLVDFIRDKFLGATSFYFYNQLENSETTVWTGDAATGGTDRHGNAVTNTTGRYLVRIYGNKLPWSIQDGTKGNFTLTFHEVFA